MLLSGGRLAMQMQSVVLARPPGPLPHVCFLASNETAKRRGCCFRGRPASHKARSKPVSGMPSTYPRDGPFTAKAAKERDPHGRNGLAAWTDTQKEEAFELDSPPRPNVHPLCLWNAGAMARFQASRMGEVAGDRESRAVWSGSRVRGPARGASGDESWTRKERIGRMWRRRASLPAKARTGRDCCLEKLGISVGLLVCTSSTCVCA